MGAASLFFIVLALFVTARVSEARDFLVGGRPNAWKIPTPTSQTLNQWAESTRFQVGDSLVWKLDGKKKDSVLEVSRADYLSCNVSSPISEHEEESTVIKLDRAGAYYFASGEKGACEKGEKMAVVVMAERMNSGGGHGGYAFFGGAGGGPSPATAPSVGVEGGPALAPASGGGRNAVVAGVGIWWLVVALAL